jgi:hypothetical protein
MGDACQVTSGDVQAVARSWPSRPATAAAAEPGKLSASSKLATTYGSTFRGSQLHRIGNHLFTEDPAHNKYYNRTEHGSFLIREALNQKNAKLPAWA